MASGTPDVELYAAMMRKLDSLLVEHEKLPIEPNPFDEGPPAPRLREIEQGLVPVDAIASLPTSTAEILWRRKALREQPMRLCDYVHIIPDITPLKLSTMYGFSAFNEMHAWALRNDQAFGTNIEDALSYAKSTIADLLVEKASQALERIGVVEFEGQEYSLNALAAEHSDAIDHEEDAKAFRLAQKLPIISKAVEVDAKRKQLIAELAYKRAAALAPESYGTQKATTQTGPVQHVSIVMDMGIKPAETPRVVNNGNSTPITPSGITLDMT